MPAEVRAITLVVLVFVAVVALFLTLTGRLTVPVDGTLRRLIGNGGCRDS
jgi:hypothetical protein